MLEKIYFISKEEAKIYPKMTNGQRVDQNLLSFRDFCMGISRPKTQSDMLYISKNLVHTEKDCIEAKKSGEFCSTIAYLAENFWHRGFCDLSSIFFTHAAKLSMKYGHFEDAEYFTQKALSLYEKNGDKAHFHARLTDLEKIYKETGQKQSLFNVLKDKEFVLEDIIANYDTTKQSFKSLKKPFASKNDFLIQLARTESDLGDLILRKNKAKALEYYRASERCYESANNKECAEFIRYRAKNSDFLNIY